MKQRLDVTLVNRGLFATRHQALGYIMAGRVMVNSRQIDKAGYGVSSEDKLTITPGQQYVSRGGLKLESVAKTLNLNFNKSVVLDVGSSTGGFSDYALQYGATKVYAVDVGRGQLEQKIRQDTRVEAMERTDIRNVKKLPELIDIAVVDVSFISLKLVLPAVSPLLKEAGVIVAMAKPQFEADRKTASMHKGVIKNDSIRRAILKELESWFKLHFVILSKADSKISGMKGNIERFYLLKPLI